MSAKTKGKTSSKSGKKPHLVIKKKKPVVVRKRDKGKEEDGEPHPGSAPDPVGPAPSADRSDQTKSDRLQNLEDTIRALEEQPITVHTRDALSPILDTLDREFVVTKKNPNPHASAAAIRTHVVRHTLSAILEEAYYRLVEIAKTDPRRAQTMPIVILCPFGSARLFDPVLFPDNTNPCGVKLVYVWSKMEDKDSSRVKAVGRCISQNAPRTNNRITSFTPGVISHQLITLDDGKSDLVWKKVESLLDAYLMTSICAILITDVYFLPPQLVELARPRDGEKGTAYLGFASVRHMFSGMCGTLGESSWVRTDDGIQWLADSREDVRTVHPDPPIVGGTIKRAATYLSYWIGDPAEREVIDAPSPQFLWNEDVDGLVNVALFEKAHEFLGHKKISQYSRSVAIRSLARYAEERPFLVPPSLVNLLRTHLHDELWTKTTLVEKTVDALLIDLGKRREYSNNFHDEAPDRGLRGSISRVRRKVTDYLQAPTPSERMADNNANVTNIGRKGRDPYSLAGFAKSAGLVLAGVVVTLWWVGSSSDSSDATLSLFDSLFWTLLVGPYLEEVAKRQLFDVLPFAHLWLLLPLAELFYIRRLRKRQGLGLDLWECLTRVLLHGVLTFMPFQIAVFCHVFLNLFIVSSEKLGRYCPFSLVSIVSENYKSPVGLELERVSEPICVRVPLLQSRTKVPLSKRVDQAQDMKVTWERSVMVEPSKHDVISILVSTAPFSGPKKSISVYKQLIRARLLRKTPCEDGTEIPFPPQVRSLFLAVFPKMAFGDEEILIKRYLEHIRVNVPKNHARYTSAWSEIQNGWSLHPRFNETFLKWDEILFRIVEEGSTQLVGMRARPVVAVDYHVTLVVGAYIHEYVTELKRCEPFEVVPGYFVVWASGLTQDKLSILGSRFIDSDHETGIFVCGDDVTFLGRHSAEFDYSTFDQCQKTMSIDFILEFFLSLGFPTEIVALMGYIRSLPARVRVKKQTIATVRPASLKGKTAKRQVTGSAGTVFVGTFINLAVIFSHIRKRSGFDPLTFPGDALSHGFKLTGGLRENPTFLKGWWVPSSLPDTPYVWVPLLRVAKFGIAKRNVREIWRRDGIKHGLQSDRDFAWWHMAAVARGYQGFVLDPFQHRFFEDVLRKVGKEFPLPENHQISGLMYQEGWCAGDGSIPKLGGLCEEQILAKYPHIRETFALFIQAMDQAPCLLQLPWMDEIVQDYC